MDNWVKLKVQGLANSQIQSGAFALILTEYNGVRRIPIIVGTAEAQSIALVLERLTPPRPLTHDLFVSFMQAFQIVLKKVCIHKLEDGIFFSKLVFVDKDQNEIEIDSRTSDAIAIALRVDAEIFTTEDIIMQSGIVLEEEGDQPKESGKTTEKSSEEESGAEKGPLADRVKKMSLASLENLLEATIADEKYEDALVIQEEINRRQQDTENA